MVSLRQVVGCYYSQARWDCHVGHPYPLFFFVPKKKPLPQNNEPPPINRQNQHITTHNHRNPPISDQPKPPQKKKKNSEKEQATTGLKSKQAGKRGRDRWCRHFSTVVLQFGSVASDRLKQWLRSAVWQSSRERREYREEKEAEQ